MEISFHLENLSIQRLMLNIMIEYMLTSLINSLQKTDALERKVK